MSGRGTWVLLAGVTACGTLLGADAGSAASGSRPSSGKAIVAGARRVALAATGATVQISPDGKRLSFLAPSHGQLNLWVKGINQPFSAARALTADSARPIGRFAWSTNGKYVLYLQDAGAAGTHLFAVAAEGGAPARDLTPYPGIRAELDGVPRNLAGAVIVGLNDRDQAVHDVYRIELESGQRTLLYRPDQEVTRWIVNRDGKLLFAVQPVDDGSTALLQIDGEHLAPFTRVCSLARGCGPLHLSADGSRLYVVDAHASDNRTSLFVMDLRSGNEDLIGHNPHKRVDLAGAVFSDGIEPVQLIYSKEGDQLEYYPVSDAGREALRLLRREVPHGDLDFGTSSDDERYQIVTAGAGTSAAATYLYDRVHGRVTLLFRGNSVSGEQLQAFTPAAHG